MRRTFFCLWLTVSVLAAPSPQVVAEFHGPMLTGVAVSRSGRIFVNYPRWGDKVTYTVTEVKNGHEVAYPSAQMSRYDPAHPKETLVAVQSVVVDPQDRLWILDTGSIKFAAPVAAKLVGVDLKTNKVFKTILFSPEVALPTTYLNDIRFDLRRNLAFITDSGEKGPNGIVVVDLASGKSWRKLDNHPLVRAEPKFTPLVEGKPLYKNGGKHLAMGSDGIAISADGKKLYFCPLASRHLYSVDTDELADPQSQPTVIDLGDKAGASDGLESDREGRIYLTNYEHHCLLRRNKNGLYATLAQVNPSLWPDTLALADGWLYFTANQLHRQADYQQGKDRRVRPYFLYRLAVPGAHKI